jgi:hypothetical protein
MEEEDEISITRRTEVAGEMLEMGEDIYLSRGCGIA